MIKNKNKNNKNIKLVSLQCNIKFKYFKSKTLILNRK